jgi:hypothetical protein
VEPRKSKGKQWKCVERMTFSTRWRQRFRKWRNENIFNTSETNNANPGKLYKREEGKDGDGNRMQTMVPRAEVENQHNRIQTVHTLGMFNKMTWDKRIRNMVQTKKHARSIVGQPPRQRKTRKSAQVVDVGRRNRWCPRTRGRCWNLTKPSYSTPSGWALGGSGDRLWQQRSLFLLLRKRPRLVSTLLDDFFKQTIQHPNNRIPPKFADYTLWCLSCLCIPACLCVVFTIRKINCSTIP